MSGGMELVPEPGAALLAPTRGHDTALDTQFHFHFKLSMRERVEGHKPPLTSNADLKSYTHLWGYTSRCSAQRCSLTRVINKNRTCHLTKRGR